MAGRRLYVLKREAEMNGGSVATASAEVGLEQNNPGGWGVSMKLTPAGRRTSRASPARTSAASSPSCSTAW